MGQKYSSLIERLASPALTRILILGQDAAGKTTLLYHLRLGQVTTTIPVIGFNLETVTYSGYCEIVSWDLVYWVVRQAIKPFFDGAKGLVFVVDSTDRDRVDESAAALHTLLLMKELEDVPVLVLANKQDVPGAMTEAEVGERLEVRTIRGRNWRVVGTSVLQGGGVYEGLDWLTAVVARKLRPY